MSLVNWLVDLFYDWLYRLARTAADSLLSDYYPDEEPVFSGS